MSSDNGNNPHEKDKKDSDDATESKKKSVTEGRKRPSVQIL